MQKLSPTKAAVQASGKSDKAQVLAQRTFAEDLADCIIFAKAGKEVLRSNKDCDFVFSQSDCYADVIAADLLSKDSATIIFADFADWQMSPDGIPLQNAEDAQFQSEAAVELAAFDGFDFAKYQSYDFADCENFALESACNDANCAASENFQLASNASNTHECAEQNSAAGNGKTKRNANFARFLAKIANFSQNLLNAGSRSANAQKTSSLNTSEKENA